MRFQQMPVQKAPVCVVFGAFLRAEPCYLSRSHRRKEAAIRWKGEDAKMSATEVSATIPGATSAGKTHCEDELLLAIALQALIATDMVHVTTLQQAKVTNVLKKKHFRN